nr:hypothetical protein CFP56_79277 [Quercus suber]
MQEGVTQHMLARTPSHGSVHDEHIDDFLYCYGWSEVTTSDGCSSVTCPCGGSGSCVYLVFNQFMCSKHDIEDLDQFSMPVGVSDDVEQELSVEEVRCTRLTMRSSYAYYADHVVSNTRTETMLSVFTGKQKSVCFTMPGYALLVDVGDVCASDYVIKAESSSSRWVLGISHSAMSQLLQLICAIGVDPVVSTVGGLDVAVRERDGPDSMVSVVTAGIRGARGVLLNIHAGLHAAPDLEVPAEAQSLIKAVSSVIATVTVDTCSACAPGASVLANSLARATGCKVETNDAAYAATDTHLFPLSLPSVLLDGVMHSGSAGNMCALGDSVLCTVAAVVHSMKTASTEAQRSMRGATYRVRLPHKRPCVRGLHPGT